MSDPAEDRRFMGTPEAAKEALIEKARAWREYRQPLIATTAKDDAMVQCGWAYQDEQWDADRWHVCGFDSKPREHEGRLVRPVYVLSQRGKE